MLAANRRAPRARRIGGPRRASSWRGASAIPVRAWRTAARGRAGPFGATNSSVSERDPISTAARAARTVRAPMPQPRASASVQGTQPPPRIRKAARRLRARRDGLRRFEAGRRARSRADSSRWRERLSLGRGSLRAAGCAVVTQLEASLARLELLGAIVEAENQIARPDGRPLSRFSIADGSIRLHDAARQQDRAAQAH